MPNLLSKKGWLQRGQPFFDIYFGDYKSLLISSSISPISEFRFTMFPLLSIKKKQGRVSTLYWKAYVDWTALGSLTLIQGSFSEDTFQRFSSVSKETW